LPTMPSLSFSIVRHPRPPRPTLFPYTTLFRSGPCNAVLERARGADWLIHEAGNGVANAEAGGQPTDVFSFSLPHPPSVNGHSTRSEEHTSELQSRENLVCRLLLEKKKKNQTIQ